MYPDKQAGTPMQATQVVYISVWKDKIMKTNTDLIYLYRKWNLKWKLKVMILDKQNLKMRVHILYHVYWTNLK